MMSTTRGDHAAPATTQQAYPWRAARRTALAVLVALPSSLLALSGLLALVAGDAFMGYLPSGWPGALVAGSTFCAILAGLVSRVLAYPVVDQWLKRVRMSSSPEPSVPPSEGGGL